MDKDKMKEITEKLEQGVQDIFSSGKFIEYLKFMSRFHHYSINNQILIFLQRPDATYVAGYHAWEKMGRHVLKGETGIRILAPSSKKIIEEREVQDKDGTKKVVEERTLVRFREVAVFDASQTEGEPLPSICDELTGSVEGFERYMKAIQATTTAEIGYEDIQGGAKGYYSPSTHTIKIKSGMENTQTIKTALHEAAHSLLHNSEAMKDEKKDRNRRETEAEGCAFVVANHFNIDTSSYSFGYLAGWSSGKEATELKESLETIRNTASKMIQIMEEALYGKQEMAIAS